MPFLERLDVACRSSFDIFFRSKSGTLLSSVFDNSACSQVDQPTMRGTGLIANKIGERCPMFTMLYVQCKRDFSLDGLLKKRERWIGTEWYFSANMEARTGKKIWTGEVYPL